MTSNPTVTVFGAYGHTGRFVVAELLRRGWTPILSGRDAAKLAVLAADNQDLETRPASIDDAASLDRALVGAAAVINAAGPFAATATPVIDAALRAGIPYLDVAAEVEVALSTVDQYAKGAREAGIAIVPAAAFYGGLVDLLATAAMGDWAAADEVSIAYALDSWRPTHGTVATGYVSDARRDSKRLVFSKGRLELRSDDPATTEWTFPEPFGTQRVQADFTTADSVTLPHHLKVSEISSHMTVAPLEDLTGSQLTEPTGVRSDQQFLVEVVVRSGDEQRRAVARGQDIYAVTAPIVVEATRRLLESPVPLAGVITVGAIPDAADFLRSLSSEHFTVELP
ncbi:trans-acting enoyl reductase family protein [Streptomyces sp. RKAG293]|uniref:saccharopine dehydrogenase family protein n=1 Tax=Streptomyces sp. RKAG293 TaxID=2893403 RepID=UPI0020343AD1|nr:saccharopine dehydrogenase NADP-binding domain-containing protein [Streptomyces sp. RKAG293]MCM2423762.1 saccharopine dehydrogenase NADP-binding domain-containing protein [Streptomyces sp. RKAG293]